ncbi:hypothetical protein GG344DRAFT_45778, partial [Lentinula edodes]
QIGQTLFKEFSTVVILKEQMRLTDPTLRDFLQHLCYRKVQNKNLIMLHTLVVGNTTCLRTNFKQDPWLEMSLVNPCHTVYVSDCVGTIDEEAIRKHCHETGKQMYICHMLDTIRNKPLNLCERYGLAMCNTNSTSATFRKKNLPDCIELAVGARILATHNIKTNLNITNGTR